MCISLLVEKFGQPLDTCLVHQSQHSLEITFPLKSSEKYCSRVCNMWSKSRILQLSEKKGPSYCSSTWVFFNWTFMKCSWRITNSFPWLLPGVPGCLSSVQLLVKSPKNVKNGTNQQIFSTHKSLHPQLLQRPDITSEREIIQYNIIDWVYPILSHIESIPYYGTHNIIDSASQIGQPLLMRVLNLPAPAQEGWGQKVHAQPPRLRGSLIHGGWEVEQGWFLVGNN